jgi:hypothetical protein
LAAILSHVEQRQVTNDYTIRWNGKFYQIDRKDVRTGMRKGVVRIEQRLDGTIAVRFQDQYVRVSHCVHPVRQLQKPKAAVAKPTQQAGEPKRKSDWMKNFSLKSSPSLRQAVRTSNARG